MDMDFIKTDFVLVCLTNKLLNIVEMDAKARIVAARIPRDRLSTAWTRMDAHTQSNVMLHGELPDQIILSQWTNIEFHAFPHQTKQLLGLFHNFLCCVCYVAWLESCHYRPFCFVERTCINLPTNFLDDLQNSPVWVGLHSILDLNSISRVHLCQPFVCLYNASFGIDVARRRQFLKDLGWYATLR